ncbi:hypothetical protein U2F26_03165 [Micromonospora sp. 4G57]|uniref:Uncharacterized protein n=1 Tax=Micromonospora sicca TaxID=2202420 RepID=A0ABU5JCH5_9ACTN|nr:MULTISPECIES: hypothetical protein [unclassified Micromonospora]MDZ5441731.1 hypothetical protein [Micromonospora sp. 4G57]MDZ5490292.1 hypothetical protein [Micromonospora sp. 4G53]
MGVLATGARRVLRRDPDTADEAVATIEGDQPGHAAGAAPAAGRAAYRRGAGRRPRPRSPAWPASRRWSSRCGRRACR